jgi:hypothetical protein
LLLILLVLSLTIILRMVSQKRGFSLKATT